MRAIICILAFSLMTAGAADRSPEEIRASIKMATTMRHPEDSPDWWRSLGSRAPKVIIEMYEASPETVERMRLIRGLSHFRDDPEAMAYVKREAEQTDQEVIRYEVLQGIAQSSASREFEFASKFLDSTDPHVRKFAARVVALASLDAASKEKADAILSGYQSKEKEPWLLKSLEKFRDETKKSAPKDLIPRKLHFKDAVDAAWEGSWSGYFVARDPKKKPPSLVPNSAQIHFRWSNPDRLEAEVVVQKEKQVLKGFAGGGRKLFLKSGKSVWEWNLRENGSMVAEWKDGVFVLDRNSK